ncbi:tail assembly protein [Achromobacter sp. D10]|uniref:tail assembly protein n=1 Tax=Achromobacter sp. D10 TaxID=3110765 RepID=UPI002B480275|nr:tail assembly protein [Achromobacter sp. D10]MEB3098844.1 tail assembly protein [Achromobacter sp. D10]
MAMLAQETIHTIRLYGEMGRLFGRVHELAVSSVGEALHALCQMIDGFQAYLTKAAAAKQEFACLYGERRIGQDAMREHLTGDLDIRIAPIIRGHKRGGLFQIVLGVVMVAAAVFTAGTAAAAFAASGWVGTAAWMGSAMVLSGIAAAISPTPAGLSGGDKVENGTSYAFNGPVNGLAQGNPFPIGYSDNDGFFWAGSAVMAQAIYSEDTQ